MSMAEDDDVVFPRRGICRDREMIMDEEDLAAAVGEEERRVLDLPELFQGHLQALFLAVAVPEDRFDWATQCF